MTRKNFFKLILGISFLSTGLNAQKSALLYAEELYEKELIDSAIFHFETALGQNPTNTELQLKLADLYRLSHKAPKAIALYEQLTKSPNTDYMSWYNYAYVLKMEGKYDKSRSVLMQLKSHPDVVGNGAVVQLIEQSISSCDFALENKSKIPAFHRIANEKAANSNASESSLYLNGNQLYYASNKTVSNIMGDLNSISDPNSDFVYVANRKNYKELVEAALLHDSKSEKFISEAADLAPFCFSTDQKMLFSSSNSHPAGLRQGFGPGNARIFQLSYAEIGSSKEMPKLKRIEFANTAANIEAGFPYVAKDGKTLYFASKGKGLEVNYGGYDLYVSTLENGSWSAPRNLGANVNGPGNEVSPFIDDQGILYFASDGHKGFGGFDVFRAEKSGENWADLRNLGFGINSSSDDLYFVMDFAHDLAYFCSNRQGGAGDYDIYSAIKLGDLSMMPKVYDDQPIQPLAANTKPVEPKNTVIKEDQQKTEIAKSDSKLTNIPSPSQSDKTALITETIASTEKAPAKTESNLSKLPCADNVYIGAISDAASKERLEGVWVYVKNKKTGEERKIKTSKYGEYSVILDAQTQYEVRCSRQGYENFAFEINTGDGERRTLLSERDMARAATNAMPEELMRENGLAARGGNAVNETFLRGPQAGKAVPASGFQIQVGVFKDINPATHKELSTLANIITEQYKDGQSKIYRLGVFADEAHAKDVLSKVQNIVGLEKSFIKKVDLQQKTTAERMNSDLMLVYPKSAPVKAEVKTETVKTETVKSETVKTETKEELKKNDQLKPTEDKKPVQSKEADKKAAETKTTAVQSEYKIQIGAYKDPSKAQLPDLKEIGETEKLLNPDNGLTYVYLKGFKTLDEAKAAAKKAEAKGVAKPFVVGFKNGKKVELSEMNK